MKGQRKLTKEEARMALMRYMVQFGGWRIPTKKMLEAAGYILVRGKWV